MDSVKSVLSYGDGYGDGSGSGSGSGYGSGYGSGDGSGSGSGSGYGSGDGYGYGDGSGYGDGYGYGDGSGSGYGDGSGYGYGDGSGSGYGDGSGDGSGSGSGSGYGSGYGSGISEFNGCTMHNIDGVQTIITSARGSVARGYTLGVDLQLTKCYIAKRDGLFAHGKTATDALKAVAKKAFAHLDTDSKIEEFKKTFNTTGLYPAQMFYDWHGRLTGSCEYGREQFVKDHGIALDSQMTVAEFVELTKSSYGGDIISRLF